MAINPTKDEAEEEEEATEEIEEQAVADVDNHIVNVTHPSIDGHMVLAVTLVDFLTILVTDTATKPPSKINLMDPQTIVNDNLGTALGR